MIQNKKLVKEKKLTIKRAWIKFDRKNSKAILEFYKGLAQKSRWERQRERK